MDLELFGAETAASANQTMVVDDVAIRATQRKKGQKVQIGPSKFVTLSGKGGAGGSGKHHILGS